MEVTCEGSLSKLWVSTEYTPRRAAGTLLRLPSL
jgi:hypothetical protein